ncbi:efflux RND transporter periplasmic adaptor subunit [Celeribacter halophilus]|uniref:efflux RND transporter periplasmic adaptor subunit n=1 Tax=Celeribacter halophilus TaxID=576117 RepID=UPI002090428F|nr:efflux RND transporter periplasmic adaptor subunit [Celeribacter halophilus]MDO6510060.1 efflux RND transporter periplasmic adaptor subunit [Celeribacter halophilus]
MATKPPVPALRPAAPEPAGKPRIWLWGALVLLGLGLLGGLSSRLWLGGAVPVVVEIAKTSPVTRVLAVNGRIAAVHSVDVSAVVSGTVVSLPVAEGEQVEANQILAQVDAAEQNAIVRQAMAALDAALVAQQKATEDYDRSLSLGSNVSKTALEADAFAKQSATQEVLRLSAFLDQARIALDNYTIRAPVAGTVLELEVETGQAISPSTSLLTLADLNDLVVEADVDESYATQIKVGQRAVLQLAGQTETHEGHVSFVSNRVDEATGGLAVKLRFDTPVAAPVGLTVTTNIIVEDRDAALTVPRTALVDGNEVFVVVDGLAELRPVTVVDWPAARLIATNGLTEGDVVIVDAAGITDGQEVEAETP